MNQDLAVTQEASITLKGKNEKKKPNNNTEPIAKYSIGTFVGEEWIYYKRYTKREETCVASEMSCVLELSVDSFELLRG